MSSFNPNALSKFDIVWLGDTKVPWFDMQWPFNGPRMQYGESIDLEDLEPVAGFAGTTDGVVFPSGNTPDDWEEILVQKLLAKHKGEWIVLRNQAKTRQVRHRIPDLQDFLNFELEYVGPRTMDSLGLEGDDTLRKVVDVLADWGFVRSEHWLNLLEKYPSLQALVPYLDKKKILFSNGTHLNHISTSEASTAKPAATVVIPDQTIGLMDGLSPDGLTLRWGGVLHSLSPTSARLVKLLVDSFERGFPYLHEEYLKTEGEFESDVRHIVRDAQLDSIVVREVDTKGKQVRGKWGLVNPK